MEEEKKQGLSRRAFLGLGGTALAGAAVAGLAGCAPQSGGDAAKATTEGASGGTTGGMPVAESGASAGPDVAGMHSWEIAPEAISADKIANTEDCDVLVIGAGLGGCCATIAALPRLYARPCRSSSRWPGELRLPRPISPYLGDAFSRKRC